MGDAPEVQLRTRGNPSDGAQDQPPGFSKGATVISHPPPPPYPKLRGYKWWFMVFLDAFFLLAGQTAAILLLRFYYNEGGSSMWIATLVQSAGAPLLILPLIFFPSSRSRPSSTGTLVPRSPPLPKTTAGIYVALGLLIAGHNLMSSYGLLYLPVSAYSLVRASQLAFNAVFSYLLNRQRLTAFMLNSVVFLTFSAAILAVNSESDTSDDVPKENYVLGFVLTLGATVIFSLSLSLMELAFEKVLAKREKNFVAVLEMQLCVGVVASCACVVGLLASGEWRSLRGEMEGYQKRGVPYVTALAWSAVLWQLTNVGTIGLTFVVSSLFASVINTISLPLLPIFAVAFFHGKMDGVMALLVAMWGIPFIYLSALP